MRSTALVLAGLAVAALGPSPSVAADAVSFYTVAYVEAGAPSAPQAAAVLRQYRSAASQASGGQRVEILQRLDRPGHFAVLGAWRDQAAFEAHAAGPAATELRDKLRLLLVSPTDERWHVALSVGTGPTAGAAGALYAVTHVDVIPPRKDDGVASLDRLAPAARQEPGNVRFDVLQQTNRPNHFTVVEVWRDRAAFDAHVTAAATRQFRAELAPISGALYDERLYAALP